MTILTGRMPVSTEREDIVKSVTVNRAELIEKIKVNQQKHADTLDKANAEYRRRFIDELQSLIVKLQAGNNEVFECDLTRPRSYLHEYDNAIGMLEMSKGEEIDIEPDDYVRWVGDRWDWSSRFSNSTAVYLTD